MFIERSPRALRLPNAPTTKFYCVYGHGKDTEVKLYTSIARYSLLLTHPPTTAIILVSRPILSQFHFC